MSEAFIGEIRLFAGNFAPQNWHLCDGSLLSISSNEALFSLIGTTYGGDGRTTFALPDLRGRVPIGQGQGPGLSVRSIGERFGSETVTLLETELPSHNHRFVVTASAPNSDSPENNLFSANSEDNIFAPGSSMDKLETLSPDTVSSTGGSRPHDNIMRSTAMHYIMCIWGVYPSRD